MKTIQLTKGQVALVDDEDFEYLNQWKWQARFNETSNGKGSYYASRYTGYREGGRFHRKYIAMHRVVMNASDGEEVDHIHHNTLDNRKSELRIVNRSLNQFNSWINSFENRAIRWSEHTSQFNVSITVAGKVIDLGSFNAVEEAVAKYKEYSKKLFESYKNYLSNYSPPPP